MKKIDKPCILQSEILDAFEKLKYKDILINNSNNYVRHFDNLLELYDFENKKVEEDSDYKPYLIKMYSQRFSSKKYPTLYEFYRIIRTSISYCPYCNFPTHSVRQLDHYFPKATFPSLSLTIDNLVPICRDCNNSKLEYFSFEKSEMLIHPYFDAFVEDAFNFFHCKIVEDNHIGFLFSIVKLDSMDEITYMRINKNFEILHLNDLYSSDFEADFSVYIEELRELYIESDENNVKEAISRKIRSIKKSNLKPWLYAGYKSILNSIWFFETYLKS